MACSSIAQHELKLKLSLLCALMLMVTTLATAVQCNDHKPLSICYYLNVKPEKDAQTNVETYTRIPIAFIFSYPKKLLILDFNNMYYEIESSSIDLSVNSGRKMIDLRSAKNGTIVSRWSTLASLPVTRHNDAIVLDQDTQPYFCLHNYPEEMTGTCYSLLNGQVHPHFNQKLLNNRTGAEFHNKLQQFTLCQKRATLMPNGAFQMTFLDNKTVTFPNELDCRLQWRANPDDPREQIFVHSGSVIITNTQFAYIFAESDMVLNGSTLVNRIPLHDLFVCDPMMKDAHFEPKEIMFMAVLTIFGSILLLEFAYLLGAFEVCFPTNLPALPPARKRTRSPSKSGSKKRRKKSPKNVKKNEAKRDEEFMEDASDGNGQENSQNTNWEESTSGGSSSKFESNNPVQASPDGSQQYQAAMQHYPQSGGTLPVDYSNVAVPPSSNVPLGAYPHTYNPEGQFQVQSEVYPGYSQAAQSQAPQSTYNEQPNSNAADINSQPNNYNNTH